MAGENHSELTKYITMGLAAGVGLLLLWIITTTNDNTRSINDHSKDISNMQKDHTTEVNRSKDVDGAQEIKIFRNESKLERQLTLIHDNDKWLGMMGRDIHHLNQRRN